MMTNQDLKSQLRDLVMIEEDVLKLIRKIDFRKEDESRLVDTIIKKQVIVSKIIGLLG